MRTRSSLLAALLIASAPACAGAPSSAETEDTTTTGAETASNESSEPSDDSAPAECPELHGHGCEWVYYGVAMDDPDPEPPHWTCQWQPHPGDPVPPGPTRVPGCNPECCDGPEPPLPPQG